jgi:uncharacterized protein Yka (UPF0111/DUF47 family)
MYNPGGSDDKSNCCDRSVSINCFELFTTQSLIRIGLLLGEFIKDIPTAFLVDYGNQKMEQTTYIDKLEQEVDTMSQQIFNDLVTLKSTKAKAKLGSKTILLS